MSEEKQANLKYEICRKYGRLGLSGKVPSKVWENLIDNEIGLINQITYLKTENKRWQEEHKRINLAGAEKVKELKQQLENLKSKLREANRVNNKNKFFEEKNKENREKDNKLLEETMASNSKLNLENAILKQQLAEKDKEIETFKNQLKNAIVLPFILPTYYLCGEWHTKILLGFDNYSSPKMEYFHNKEKDKVIKQAEQKLKELLKGE